MNIRISSTAVLLSSCLLIAMSAGAQSVDDLIAQAIQPLPEDLKAEARVYAYDAESGERTILREGSNQVECKPRDERGFTLCFPRASADYRDLRNKHTLAGLEGDDLNAVMDAAVEAGTVEASAYGSILYRLYEKDDRIQLLWVVLLPNATAEDLGMSIESQRDNSLAGMGRPWMMREGTPGAHLMIPINKTALSNNGGAKMALDTKSITDPVAHSVLPLPEDLRAGAAVISYDANGMRSVLREGSNMIECTARDPDSGFTRCYHKMLGKEADLRAKLSVEGKSNQEIGAAIAAARAAGSIDSPPSGTIAYRLYEEDDKLKLLWVLRLPNATSAELGMPTGSQRDNSLAGKGKPWMMREGTPTAHLMIPINGTELSNQP